MTRLGLLGGTFDPPHVGHLVLAELAREQLGLDRVLWVPAGVQPLKQGQDVTPIEQRLGMLHLALESPPQPAFEISRIDVDRPGPHYTVDTLDLLVRAYSGAELVLLIGGDSLRDLPRFNGIPIYHFYFDAAMETLRNRFLKMPETPETTP